MSHNASSLPLIASVLLLAVVVSGCMDPPVEPSLLDGPRVLAVRAQIDDDQQRLSLDALTWNATTHTWRTCPTPWLPAPDPRCSSAEGESPGEGASIETELPSSSVWLRLDVSAAPGETGVPAVIQIDPTVELAPLQLDGITAEPTAGGFTLGPSGEAPPSGVVTWFTTRGRVVPWRTLGGATATLELGDEDLAEPVQVFAVLRDLGAVVWATVELQP
ncbi:MAG: hypothetical protein ACI9WU_000068 [Myxococcota bacterium]|jgi:hypothetical protein